MPLLKTKGIPASDRLNCEGWVKKLKPPHIGYRLRCSDYRVFFDHKEVNTIEITSVLNRREAYRRSPT